jgi:uncharacterized protein YbbK (DUF523 family)
MRMNPKKIMVSACLLGERVRYDAKILPDFLPIFSKWVQQGLVIPVCPEVAGGLPTPRPPAEIQAGDGKDVAAGTANVTDINGKDVTDSFLAGAKEALRLAENHGVECAILKACSPSCGSKRTYDGSFSGTLKNGQGVTAALLLSAGIVVFNEEEIDQALDLIDD